MIATLEPVRTVVPNRARRDGEKAVADLRALVKELEKAEGFYNEAMALFQLTLQRQNKAENAVMAALEAKDAEKLASALEAPEITPEFLGRQQAALSASKSYGVVFNTFLNTHPEAKALLVAVAKQKLEQARAEAERAFSDEQARLGGEYNAEDSPVVKRARVKVSSAQTALNRVEAEPIANTFVPFASQLLSND